MSLLDRVKSQAPNGIAHVYSRSEVVSLSKALGPIRADFLLLLVDKKLNLLDAWRLPREQGSGVQGFPISRAIQLALKAKAAGMIVIQERVADLVPRRPDIELSQHLKDALAETEIYLLDHFLVSGDSLSACRPK